MCHYVDVGVRGMVSLPGRNNSRVSQSLILSCKMMVKVLLPIISFHQC